MESALSVRGAEKLQFEPPQYSPAEDRSVVMRDGLLQADNGYCRGAHHVLVFYGEAPRKTANCKPNEVEVPKVVGSKLAAARHQLATTPLSPTVVYKPASLGQPVGVVVRTIPRAGARLSAGERVDLVLVKAEHGVIPKLIGMPLDSASEKLEGLKVKPDVHGEGRVVAQRPRWGTALIPGATVTLVARAG
jgi:hypothetical protein